MSSAVAAGAAASEIWAQGHQNVFQIDAQARDYFDLVLEFAHGQGLTRVAVVYAGTDFPREGADGVREEAARLCSAYPDAGVYVLTLRLHAPDVSLRPAGPQPL